MKNTTTKSLLALTTLSLVIISSCGKKVDNPTVQNKEAIMKMEVICKGDIQSQVAVLTFLAVNAAGELISIANDTTGKITAGPFLQNSDFASRNLITFHSTMKVSSVSVMLAISPKVYATTQDENFSMTIKIYFDGNLRDNQTFSYDQLSGGDFTTPKDCDYKVNVN